MAPSEDMASSEDVAALVKEVGARGEEKSEPGPWSRLQ